MADKKMGNIEAIRTFFNTPGYPEVKLAELKELDKKDREELGGLCRIALMADTDN